MKMKIFVLSLMLVSLSAFQIVTGVDVNAHTVKTGEAVQSARTFEPIKSATPWRDRSTLPAVYPLPGLVVDESLATLHL